jgi:hypothetical protein
MCDWHTLHYDQVSIMYAVWAWNIFIHSWNVATVKMVIAVRPLIVRSVSIIKYSTRQMQIVFVVQDWFYITIIDDFLHLKSALFETS